MPAPTFATHTLLAVKNFTAKMGRYWKNSFWKIGENLRYDLTACLDFGKNLGNVQNSGKSAWIKDLR